MRTEHIQCTEYHALRGPDGEDNIEEVKEKQERWGNLSW